MDFKKSIISLATVCVASGAFAGPATVIMPNCLEQALKLSHEVKQSTNKLSLVTLADDQLEALALAAHKTHCGGFVNVSEDVRSSKNQADFLIKYQQTSFKTLNSVSYKINNQTQVNDLIKNVEPKNIWHTLEGMTSFDDRYSRGNNGRKAALWLQDKFIAMSQNAKRDDVTTFLVETGGSYVQPSVVTLVGKDLPGKAVVLGAHMDTLSYMKPGADDDGSGSSSLMEAARVILNAEKLNSPVYFIWYSAEEMGLVGSKQVVKHFVKNNLKVKSALQFDMTGYRYNGSDKMWMISDNVDSSLSKFVESLINQYVGVKVAWTKCGYACSDHASWTQIGVPSAFPFEARFGEEDPYIHTGNDLMKYVSLEHMTNFAKLGVAFAVEQANN